MTPAVLADQGGTRVEEVRDRCNRERALLRVELYALNRS